MAPCGTVTCNRWKPEETCKKKKKMSWCVPSCLFWLCIAVMLYELTHWCIFMLVLLGSEGTNKARWKRQAFASVCVKMFCAWREITRFEGAASFSCYFQNCLHSVLAVCIPHMQTPAHSIANDPGCDLVVKCNPVRPHHQDIPFVSWHITTERTAGHWSIDKLSFFTFCTCDA